MAKADYSVNQAEDMVKNNAAGRVVPPGTKGFHKLYPTLIVDKQPGIKILGAIDFLRSKRYIVVENWK